MPQAPTALVRRTRAAWRIALTHEVANGLSVALGLFLISGAVHLWLGATAAATAAVGVLISSPPDRASPRRGKFWQMLPAPLLSLPLFFAVQWMHSRPLELGLLLIPATFFVFLAMAWGRRGIPIAIAVMLAMVFSMALQLPSDLQEALARTWHLALGAGLYVLYSTLANLALNARYRVQLTADTLLSVAALMRTEASQFPPVDARGERRAVPAGLQGRLLAKTAALADQLQSTRDIVLESPRTPRRQRLAAMLVIMIEMRDHLLASELDLEALTAEPALASALAEMRSVMLALADSVEALADDLLMFRRPALPPDLRATLATIRVPGSGTTAVHGHGPSPAMLARGLASRIGHLNDELVRMNQIARNDIEPDLAVVRANWQLFVSPTAWSWRPFVTLWRWDAPPLRHAIRAALAIAAGYGIALALPWGSHDYWILLTIVVVLRGSLSQTLERRNERVAGTLLGCVLAVALLSTHPTPLVLLLCVTLAQGIAHAFAVRKYLVTAVAATVLGLTQAHMLNVGASPTFALVERIADTLIGAGLAWAFCYVLPSWERSLIPALVRRTLKAQALHARIALGLGQLRSVDAGPELEWRLARREAFDSLSALVQATQRSLSEPRAVRPALEPLERLQAHSYQLLAQLSAVKSMLLLRRDRLARDEIEGPLARTAQRIDALIGAAPTDTAPAPPPSPASPASTLAGAIPLLDPFDNDITPWLLRRLDLATGLTVQLRDDAATILQGPARTAP